MFNSKTLSLATIQSALSLESFDVLRAQMIMAPLQRRIARPAHKEGAAKEAAVMVLLYPHLHDLHLVLIRRNRYPGVHSDQVGLPGGKREQQETFLQAALRETHEELGVVPQVVQLLGQLTPIYIPPSDFEVHPFVGYTTSRPVWMPDPKEVSGVIETPVAALLDDTIKCDEEMTLLGSTVRVPYYDIQGNQVWGATAIMLSEFEGRLRSALESQSG